VTIRSVTEFPQKPEPHKLRASYEDMRVALKGANISRGQLSALAERRGLVIKELQAELFDLESTLANEGQTKAKLHAINSNLLGVIREMEEAGDEMVKVIQQAEEADGGFWMIHQLKKLLGLATRWMDAKERAADIAVVNAATTEPVELGQ
jgi:hypothetical protein